MAPLLRAEAAASGWMLRERRGRAAAALGSAGSSWGGKCCAGAFRDRPPGRRAALGPAWGWGCSSAGAPRNDRLIGSSSHLPLAVNFEHLALAGLPLRLAVHPSAAHPARIMGVLRHVFGFLMLSLCLGQTTSPSTSPTPTPCSAPPGYFCSGGAALLCPVGAYCAGGTALNVSCYPMTACTVAGLSAQPPCYWDVSNLAGNGVAGWADGLGTAARLNAPIGIFVDPLSLNLYATDYMGNRVRKISPSGNVSTIAGSGAASFLNGLGTAASFFGPHCAPSDSSGNIYVADYSNQRLRQIFASGMVVTLAGSGIAGGVNGFGTAAQFHGPTDIALNASGGAMGYIVEQLGCRIRCINFTTTAVTTLAGSGVAGFMDGIGVLAQFNKPTTAVLHPRGLLYVADGWGGCVACENHRIRVIDISTTVVSTLAGSGAAGSVDGVGTAATFNQPRGIALDAAFSTLFVSEQNGNRIRSIDLSTKLVQTIAGSGSPSYANGFGVAASFNAPLYLSFSPQGILYTADADNHRIRKLTCVPCPASYYCSSGAPVLCPAGSYCPLSSINAKLCPRGSFSTAGAATCTLCLSGTFATSAGSTTCRQCPGGHYCPAGASSWARLNCGRGNYCPDGSGAPMPCPYQVPPSGGWGALQVQGPAFIVETAHCINHCFWNFTSGDSMLSKC